MEQVCDNVNVQMMAEWLEKASYALATGNIPDAATYLRIAYSYQENIPNNLRFKS
jgi:hypothetical protein